MRSGHSIQVATRCLNEQLSHPSLPPVSSRSHSTCQPPGFYSWLLRGILAGVVIALVVSNVLAEFYTARYLQARNLTPLDRYNLLIGASSMYPLDRNLRQAPETFRAAYNALVTR